MIHVADIARVVGVSEVDVRRVEQIPHLDAFELRLYNRRRIVVPAIEVFRRTR